VYKVQLEVKELQAAKELLEQTEVREPQAHKVQLEHKVQLGIKELQAAKELLEQTEVKELLERKAQQVHKELLEQVLKALLGLKEPPEAKALRGLKEQQGFRELLGLRVRPEVKELQERKDLLVLKVQSVPGLKVLWEPKVLLGLCPST
jgi:hypothetical protein